MVIFEMIQICYLNCKEFEIQNINKRIFYIRIISIYPKNCIE